MSDLRIVPRAFLSEFIQLYRNNPCLWKIRSIEYSDKTKQNKKTTTTTTTTKENVAYEQLRVKLPETDSEATKEAMVK
jgi:hypothetical protein